MIAAMLVLVTVTRRYAEAPKFFWILIDPYTAQCMWALMKDGMTEEQLKTHMEQEMGPVTKVEVNKPVDQTESPGTLTVVTFIRRTTARGPISCVDLRARK